VFQSFTLAKEKNWVKCTLISDIKDGELRMLDIESLIEAKRVIRLKKFLQEYPS